MILVDTSVWIDFFAGRSMLEHVKQFKRLISQRQEIALCGIILTEILQGIKEPQQYQQVKEHLLMLNFLPMTQQTFIFATDIYRTLRKNSLTIRKTADCLIAAVAIENDIQLLHNDRDFSMVTKHFPLKFLG